MARQVKSRVSGGVLVFTVVKGLGRPKGDGSYCQLVAGTIQGSRFEVTACPENQVISG